MMRVVVIQNKLTDTQKSELKVSNKKDFEWQITLGKSYVVFSIRNILNSTFYGNGVLFEIEDDFGRLLSVPACLFEIVDPRPSKYWLASIENTNFVLEVEEFSDDPSLSEKLMDRAPEALSVFEAVKIKLESE